MVMQTTDDVEVGGKKGSFFHSNAKVPWGGLAEHHNKKHKKGERKSSQGKGKGLAMYFVTKE